MSAPDPHEYDSLIAAFANRELTEDERQRLDVLVADDAARCTEVADLEMTHSLFDLERGLSGEVAVPVNMAEAGDESFQRVEAAAARAEAQLRAHLQHPVPLLDSDAPELDAAALKTAASKAAEDTPADARPALLMFRPKVLAVAAILIASLTFAMWPDAAPQMMTGKPGREVLGGARIHLNTELHADLPVLHWEPVLGANRYAAIVLTASGDELLRWPNSKAEAPTPQAVATRWELSANQYGQLKRAESQKLRLRILAFDGDREIARSADLPLLLVD